MKTIILPEHIVQSVHPDVQNIPDTDIYSFIFDRERTGNYPPQSGVPTAFIDAPNGYELFFSALKEKVDFLARSLYHKVGIQEHDIVCFFAKNHV
jgi:hypothetical protein